jgi:hypothetical protein
MEKRLGSKREEQTVKGSTTDEKGEEEKTTDLWPSCRSRNRRQFPFPWLCRALHRKKECLESRKRKNAKASWNHASTDTLSSGGARLVSFSHPDATHMHAVSKD